MANAKQLQQLVQHMMEQGGACGICDLPVGGGKGGCVHMFQPTPEESKLLGAPAGKVRVTLQFLCDACREQYSPEQLETLIKGDYDNGEVRVLG